MPADTQASTRGDLRTRKKQRTREAIRVAALDLFVEKGFEETTVDEIADRAEVSKATFFRYFASKAEVIFSSSGDNHCDLFDAVVGRPAAEGDLTAVRRALVDEWVGLLDVEYVRRQGRAAATSPLLRGISYDLGMALQKVIANAVAARHGLDAPDQRCRLVGALAFAAISSAFHGWAAEGAVDDRFVVAVEHAFALLDDVVSADPAPR